MYSLVITKSAKQDLQETLLYIKEKLCSPKAAEDLYSEFVEKTAILRTFPKVASLANDKLLARLGIRTLLIKNYFAVYTIDEDSLQVIIIRFLYAKSDYTALLHSSIENQGSKNET